MKASSMTVAARAARRKKPGPVVQAGDLLAWYDRNRRILPWRATGRAKSDPYRVWLSEIMLQQTTVKTVAPYYARFLQRWPDVEALASAPLNDVLKAWAGLGYYARARNLHACAKAVVECHAGEFPPDQIALRALPGIGPYTAAAIAAIAFDIPAVPVDGNVERVVSRLFAVEAELPAAKGEFQALAATLATPYRAGDFAQALMDLGSGICTPKKPACVLCPWTDGCAARKRGDAETFPRKTPKVEGRLRKGAAFVAVRADGAVLLRARPMKGLLGGMTEVPTSEWSHDFIERKPAKSAPHFQTAAWRRLRGAVTHVFTHFPLQLAVYRAELPKGTRAPKGTRFVPARELHGEALPNLMRKVIAHALEHASEIKPKRGRN